MRQVLAKGTHVPYQDHDSAVLGGSENGYRSEFAKTRGLSGRHAITDSTKTQSTIEVKERKGADT